MKEKELFICDVCGTQFYTSNDLRSWCSAICRKILNQKYGKLKLEERPDIKNRMRKIPTTEDKKKLKHDIKFSDQNFYWILKYMKRLGEFFASDIVKELEKDDIYFTTAQVLVAIEYWIDRKFVAVSHIPYMLKFGGRAVKKYIWNVETVGEDQKIREDHDAGTGNS